MVAETGKAVARRLRDSRYATRYLTGSGIDIGSGDDPLDRYARLFPGITAVRCWDKQDGDAQTLPGLDTGSFDFVHASHVLEHLQQPENALRRWISVCRPGGHLLITVPDDELYEHGQWPSRFNAEHKWAFSLSSSPRADRPHVLNMLDLLMQFRHRVDILSAQLLDAGYDPSLPADYDQSLLIACEPAIEIILRKRGAHG